MHALSAQPVLHWMAIPKSLVFLRFSIKEQAVAWCPDVKEEGVSEAVIAAVLLLHERTVEEVVSKLTAGELEQVIKPVARSPGCYPPLARM